MIYMRCAECGSSEVSRDAAVRWNYEEQKWEAQDPYDDAYCDKCGEEVDLMESEE